MFFMVLSYNINLLRIKMIYLKRLYNKIFKYFRYINHKSYSLIAPSILDFENEEE